MLNKPNTSIPSRSAAVKKMTRALALSACLGTIGFAATAQASSDPLVERVITVEFKKADLMAENGVSAVYDRLESKAKRECKADRSTLRYTGQSLEACMEDLLDQFVESSQVESLQDLHQAKAFAKTQTLALNTQTAAQN